jgi:hypothetical protein
VNNEIKNNLGLKASWFYGLAKHQIQLYATAFVYNIRQALRLLQEVPPKSSCIGHCMISLPNLS